VARKSKKEKWAPGGLIIIRFHKDGGSFVNLVDCQLHDAIGIMETALRGMQETHRADHDGRGDWEEKHREINA